MKDLILDEFSQTEIRKKLEPNEIVIWEGRPYRNIWGGIFFLVGVMLYVLWGYSTMGAIAAIMMGLYWGKNPLKQLWASRNTRYLITKERIIFQLYKNRKKHFLSISFDEIKSVSIYKEAVNPKNGKILLNMKESKETALVFFDGLGNKQERPFLELIQNVEEVASYIKMGIQNKL